MMYGSKFNFVFAVCCLGTVIAWANQVVPHNHIVTVQIAVRGKDSKIKNRDQRLVLEEINQELRVWPEAPNYELKTAGDEVILTLMSAQDPQTQMKQAVYRWIRQWNGRLRARGNVSFYKTNLEQPIKGYLKVIVSDDKPFKETYLSETFPTHQTQAVAEIYPTPTQPPLEEQDGSLTAIDKKPPSPKQVKIKTISAHVPLRELLLEIQKKALSFSYVAPSGCMEKHVNWSYGVKGGSPALGISEIMSQLGTFLDLKYEYKYGTHIFSGNCSHDIPAEEHLMMAAGFGNMDPLFQQAALPAKHIHGKRKRKVFIPLMPLTY